MNLLPIQICSLEAVREIDTSLYDGVITVEDSDIEDPFRVDEYFLINLYFALLT